MENEKTNSVLLVMKSMWNDSRQNPDQLHSHLDEIRFFYDEKRTIDEPTFFLIRFKFFGNRICTGIKIRL